MKDHVEFIDNIYENGELIFESGLIYEVLDEIDDVYYIQRISNTNQVTQFSKKLEGVFFKFI